MKAYALAAAFAAMISAQAAAAEDPVHGEVQKFLNVIQAGGDFAASEFKEAVKAADAPRLRALASCDLDSVKRSDGNTSAIVLFTCPAAAGKVSTAVMIMFSGGKAVAVEPMSSVHVPERG